MHFILLVNSCLFKITNLIFYNKLQIFIMTDLLDLDKFILMIDETEKIRWILLNHIKEMKNVKKNHK